MSNHLAIATVTSALQNLIVNALTKSVTGLEANVLLGRPSDTGTSARVYLYLYQVTPNAALRNADLPNRNSIGGLVQRPRIALDLHYLLAFYGTENDLTAHLMLGAVTRELHANPVLTRGAISEVIRGNDGLTPSLAASNLAESPEQVKFKPVSLSLEEMSKIWYVFMQTPHALSMVYQASVVLIDAEEAGAPALRVLKRGSDNRGVQTYVGRSPFPHLDEIHIGDIEEVATEPRPRSYPSAQLPIAASANDAPIPASRLTLSGGNWHGDVVQVQFRHPRLRDPIEPILDIYSATGITIDLKEITGGESDLPWLSGIYTVDILTTIFPAEGEQERTTNSMSLALAPRITQPIGVTVDTDWPSAGDELPFPLVVTTTATLTVTCVPKVLPEQEVVLLVGNIAVVATERRTEPTNTLTFEAKLETRYATNAELEQRTDKLVDNELVRLRVDGVDSMSFRYVYEAGKAPLPEYDSSPVVTIVQEPQP